MTDNLQRDIGKHDAQIEAMQAELVRVHGDMAKVIDRLEKIQNTLSEAKGGWRTLMWVGGASGVIGAGIANLVTYLSSFPTPR